jgi:hypothetical protein
MIQEGWEIVVMVYFKILSQYIHGGIKKIATLKE